MTITNPFFQATDWQTAPAGDPRGAGNQIPNGWTLVVTPRGQLMPWPTKGARDTNGAFITLDAEAGGPGEHVHKTTIPAPSQLPDDELFGKTRALLVLPNTDKIYKGFGGVPHAFTLSQKLTERPGTKKQYLLYILAETTDKPTPPHADLEPDHFRARLSVGGVTVESHYSDMRTHKTISGNERAWNTFVIPSFEFPASGEAQMTIACQKNWPGLVDFFIAGVVEQTIGVPGGDDAPPTTAFDRLQKLAIGLSYTLSNVEDMAAAARLEMQVLQAEIAKLKTGGG
jgi:hypothetical protein